MIEINVFKPIDSEDAFMTWMFGEDNTVFSADSIHKIFDENKSEKEFKFNINCNGGSVHEGLRIYDVLRTSDKTIYTNIEGGCHSMSLILLLAAPAENRSANRNARALIHEVRTDVYENVTSDELLQLADYIEAEQQNILDIYEERTGSDRETLEKFMKEEKMRDANFLKEYGFISNINNYTTNFRKMNKKNGNKNTSLLNRVDKFLGSIKNLLQDEPVNFDFTDADGNVLFSTESESDTLETGMAATPDGTFELPDGRTITIEGGIITEILEADEELENLREQNETLTNSLREAERLINELKTQVKSSYNVAPRVKQPLNKSSQEPTSAERKQAIVENRKTMKGGK